MVPWLSKFAICKGSKEGNGRGWGGVLSLSKSVELNIELVEQSLYHYKYDWKA